MDKKSRRAFLQKGALAAGSVTMIKPGAASGSENKPNEQSLRLRGGKNNPITPSRIKDRKSQILKSSPNARSGDGTPRRSKVDLGKREHIVAYNLDIVDGAPKEWVGVFEQKPSKAKKKRKKPEKVINNIHKKANENAQKKNNGGSE